MQKRWTGKNVNLNLLSERVESYFKNKGFMTKRTESEGELILLLVPQHTEDVRKTMMTKTAGTQTPQYAPNVKGMTAKIIGDPNDFTIEFTPSEITRRSIWLGMLTKIFGGGYLILQSLKLREALEKLEREFSIYIEDEIANLAGSVRHRV